MNPLALLRLVPGWAWAILAALAWGAYQHHVATAAGARALQAQKDLAELRAEAAKTAIDTLAKTATHYSEVSRDAQALAVQHQAAAAGAADAVRRLRERATAAAGAGCPPAAAAAGSAPAAAGPVVPAVVFDRVAEAAGRYAAIADERGRAGSACERAAEGER